MKRFIIGKFDAIVMRIGVSIGTVGALRLDYVPMETAPTTAYLMLGGRCVMDCAFCAQARTSTAGALYLSRVTWPEFDLDAVLDGLRMAAARGEIKRVCLQVTVNRNSYKGTLEVVRAVKSVVPDLPVDAAILPQDLTQADALLEAGVDHLGIGLDAVCERVFRRVKGDRWRKVISLLEAAARRYPGRLAAHLIIGLGESEREAVQLVQWLHDRQITVGLFAFTPVRGTRMAETRPPSLGTYRRVQAARHLICVKGFRSEQFVFDGDGRLIGFGLADWATLLSDGEAFRTSGCPDCNRPFYNERPGGTMYNYPRPLRPEEVQEAIAAMELDNDVVAPGLEL